VPSPRPKVSVSTLSSDSGATPSIPRQSESESESESDHEITIKHRALLGLTLLGSGSAFAITEVEPNNLALSTQVISPGTNGSPVLVTGAPGNTNGNGSNPPGKDNSDFSTVTNSAGYSTIGVSVQFDNSLGGGSSARLLITGPNVNEDIDVNGSAGLASFTIISAQSGATYVVEIRTQFNDGQINYTLTYDPSPDMGLIGQIDAKQAEIAEIQDCISNLESAIASKIKGAAKQKKQLKKAKTTSKKKKINKAIAKLNSSRNANKLWLATRKGELSTAEAQLGTLQNQFANLQAQQ